MKWNLTNSEAIQAIKDNYPPSNYTILREALDMSMQALENQIPKKVYYFKYDDTFETTCCGTDITNKDYQYCPYCGQKLGEVEVVEK